MQEVDLDVNQTNKSLLIQEAGDEPVLEMTFVHSLLGLEGVGQQARLH